MNKPPCGGSSPGDDWLKTLITLITAIAGAIGTGIGIWVDAVSGTASPLLTTLFTYFGYAAPAGAVAGAVAGGIITYAIIVYFAWDRLKPRQGIRECYAGVITGMQEAYKSATDVLFPFTAQHDRVDVVIKPSYWDIAARSPQQWIWCNSDSMQSPLIRTYYWTKEVAGGITGAMYGGAVGAGVEIAVGLLAGVAIGCATIILCIVAIIVAALIAAALVLAGAFTGAAGCLAAGGSSSPTGDAPDGKKTLRLSDYVSVHANLVIFPDDQNAWVAWWAEFDHRSRRIHLWRRRGRRRPLQFCRPARSPRARRVPAASKRYVGIGWRLAAAALTSGYRGGPA